MIPCNQDISLGWVDIVVEFDLMCCEQFLNSFAFFAKIHLNLRCLLYSDDLSLRNQINGGMV